MTINCEHIGRAIIVTAPGDCLDASNSKRFKEDMAPLIDAHDNIVLDMSALEFVDSSGLGAILSCFRAVKKRNGEFLLCGLTQPVRTLFEIVRMHRIFDILPNRDEAVKRLS